VRDVVREVVREEVRLVLREEIAGMRGQTAASGACEYLAVSEAAEVAGVHEATIRAWIAQGQLPGHRAGRHHRVRRDELQRFMSSEKERSTIDLETRVARLAAA
jgi:excisionase family DNA binding protein